MRLLGVKWETLEAYGAVSQETVLEMALGVRRAFAADVGLSISGVAGPGGGTPEKPVGLTWIGLSAPQYQDAQHFVWDGDRLKNKEYSVQAAMDILAKFLQIQVKDL